MNYLPASQDSHLGDWVASSPTAPAHEGDSFTPVQRMRGLSKRTDVIVTALLLAVWLAVVIFTTTRHEYWRDEVRAWSLARTAGSPLDLFHLIRYEGHPALWYLILYLGHLIVDSPLVLPIASVAIAGAAVTVFMFRSPFPLWLKALFLFSCFPLYEYSVKARNYGLSMLCLFLAASLYRGRARQWLPLAISLALLANTNIHSMPLTFLLMAVWIWDEKQSGRLLVPVGIATLGMVLSLVIVIPPRDTVLTAAYSKTPGDFVSAFGASLMYPRAGFRTLFPSFLPWAFGHAVLYLAILGLLRRPILSVAALGGLVAFGMLFRLGSPGDYRHAGVYLCFLLTLYWIAADKPECDARSKGRWRLVGGVGYAALTALILASVYRSRAVPIDVAHPMSSSKALGAFLNAAPSFREAILVPEPDYYIESLRFYLDTPIYLARERRFGNMASWSSANVRRLSLGELVAQAQHLKAQYRRPVLVVLGHPGIRTDSAGEARMFYRKRFTWSAREREELERSSVRVAEFWTAFSDENYSVYAVK